MDSMFLKLSPAFIILGLLYYTFSSSLFLYILFILLWFSSLATWIRSISVQLDMSFPTSYFSKLTLRATFGNVVSIKIIIGYSLSKVCFSVPHLLSTIVSSIPWTCPSWDSWTRTGFSLNFLFLIGILFIYLLTNNVLTPCFSGSIDESNNLRLHLENVRCQNSKAALKNWPIGKWHLHQCRLADPYYIIIWGMHTNDLVK